MSRRNFSSPWTFAPSRWLNDPQYAGDKLDALQPFSTGARNCIGKKSVAPSTRPWSHTNQVLDDSLANAEIALVLTRLLWEFDITLSDETDSNWPDQQAWFTWNKKPLVVKLQERTMG